MRSFSHKVELTDVVQSSRATVAGESLPRALMLLFLLDRIPDLEELRANVEKTKGIVSMFSTVVHDHQGRMVFKAPGFGGDEDGNELQYRYLMARDRGHQRQVEVGGYIDPVRRLICAEHMVSEDVFLAMFEESPFVPLGHEHIFARGAFRFVGGDDMEAASLIIPQLENSLRHLLGVRGIDTTRADNSGTQTEASLSILLSKYRNDLEEIAGPKLVNEMDLLFNFPGGPALRNSIAHAKIAAGGFWSHEMVYGTWFVIHMAILPLLERVEEVEAKMAGVMGLPSEPR